MLCDNSSIWSKNNYFFIFRLNFFPTGQFQFKLLLIYITTPNFNISGQVKSTETRMVKGHLKIPKCYPNRYSFLNSWYFTSFMNRYRKRLRCSKKNTLRTLRTLFLVVFYFIFTVSLYNIHAFSQMPRRYNTFTVRRGIFLLFY